MGIRGCVPTIGGITLFSLPGKVYSRVLERRIRPIVEPRIQKEQFGFLPGRGTLNQLYTLHRVLKGLWEFAPLVHVCFVGLEKAFNQVNGESKSDLFPVPVGLRKGCPLSLVLFIIFMDRISRCSHGLEESGLGATGSHLCFLQMMLSCWLLRARNSNMSWGGLQPSVKQLG